jgi:PKHD-type hydroxylase
MMKFGQANQTVAPQISLYAPVYISNALNDAAIRELESIAHDSGFQPAEVGGNEQGNLNKNVRRSNVAWLRPDKLSQETLRYFESMILDVNEHHFKFDLDGFESFQFTVYDEKVAGEYKWHVDTMSLPDGMVRKLSISILLSEQADYEGGRLLLSPDGNTVVAEERKGRAVVFPSWVPHCVVPVTKGVRKSLVIWAHGPAFK